MQLIRQSTASHDRQISELKDSVASNTANIATTTANIARLVDASNRDGNDIRALARIVASLDARMERIDEGDVDDEAQ